MAIARLLCLGPPRDARVLDKHEFRAAMRNCEDFARTGIVALVPGPPPCPASSAIDGVDVAGLDSRSVTHFRREKVGLVFQQFHLVSYLTALENVMLAQYFHSIVGGEEAREALVRVGLGERLTHLPSQLSGGEQQRVCIARALINQPKLILADEPTGNLDQRDEELVMEIFYGLHAAGNTILMVTHDLEIGSAADRVVRLDHGRVVRHEHASTPILAISPTR